jgi:hypothetical protein
MTTHEFLHEVYGALEGGLLALKIIPEQRTEWFAVPGELAAAADRALELGTTTNVYVGVSTQRERLKDRTAANAAEVPALFADLDVGEGTNGKRRFASKDDALAFTQGLPIRPTLVVDSGHGLQPWWVLREALPAAIGGGLMASWGAFLTARAQEGGVDLDAVWEPARVLRVPGTWNRKGDPLPVHAARGRARPIWRGGVSVRTHHRPRRGTRSRRWPGGCGSRRAQARRSSCLTPCARTSRSSRRRGHTTART